MTGPGADLLWEKNIIDWLIGYANLMWEKNTDLCWFDTEQ